MGLRGKMLGPAMVMSMSTLPFVLDVDTAAADERYYQEKSFDVTYTNELGRAVVCRVAGVSSISRSTGDPTFESHSITSIEGPEGDCNGFAAITETYRNANGEQRRSTAVGENTIILSNDDIGSDYTAEHHVSFFHCSANCNADFTTRPK